MTGVWTGEASIEFVTVGDPGNAADTAVMWWDGGTTGYGSVPYVYQMGKYDVTVGQYVEFLNAVAKTDTYGLYNSTMHWSPINITRSGDSGSYSYAVAAVARRSPIFPSAMFCGARRRDSATGWKTASPPVPKAAGRRKLGHTRSTERLRPPR